MAYQQSADIVSGEQYRYALANFRIAHEKVEEQRTQLEQQERQNALLRERIAVLEGTSTQNKPSVTRQGGSSVDDFTIKNAASQLERQINRWASDIIRSPTVNLDELRAATLSDLLGGDVELRDATRPVQVQNLLRHAMAETISEAVINCLIVTSSSEANIQLARIHEHIFARDPTVAAVWRRQTFSAAVESIATETTRSLLKEQLPALTNVLGAQHIPSAAAVIEQAYTFSRMLHGSPSTASGTLDTFYRSFVPELQGQLYPRQVELVKRCVRSERGETDRVGATIFPGLVKVSHGAQAGENAQTVVRRAQVICECALQAAAAAPVTMSIPTPIPTPNPSIA